MLVASEILHALERDLEEKRHDVDAAELLFSDAAEKLNRLCVAGLYEEAAAWAGNVRILAMELVVATEAWLAAVRRASEATGV